MQDTVPEGQRLLTALLAASDIAYAWNVRSGAIEWLSDPAVLGAQFGSIRNADSLAARIHAEDATNRAEALARHLAGGGAEPYECEYRIRDDHDDPDCQVHRDGERVPGLREHYRRELCV